MQTRTPTESLGAWGKLGLLAVAVLASACCCGGRTRLRPPRFKRNTTVEARHPGPFRSVVASAHHTCLLYRTGRAQCFGGDDTVTPPMVPTPTDAFRTIATGRRFACGIVEGSREIKCWGACVGSTCVPPAGAFDDLFLGDSAGCATRTGGGVVCFGAPLPATPPTVAREELVQIVIGMDWAVGRRPDGTLVTWGGHQAVATDPRLAAAIGARTRYRSIGGAGAELCLVDLAGTITCLAHHGNPEPPHARGAVVQVAFSNPRGARPACVLWDDPKSGHTTTSCTSGNKGKPLAPIASALALAAGDDHVCGLLGDGSVSCNGLDDVQQVTGKKAWP